MSRRLSIFSSIKKEARPAIPSEDIAKHSASRIVSLFSHFSNENYIGEPVSILEHSWQAYELAVDADENPTVALACLLHDVGHLLGLEAGFPPGMNGFGTPDHENIAANFLKKLHFPDDLSYLVSQHVNAKRYLVHRVADYPLSEASKATLEFQGGKMTEEECVEAEKNPLWQTVIRMRRYDELSKQTEMELPDDIMYLIYQLCYAEVMKSMTEKKVYSFSPYTLSSEQERYYELNGYLLIKSPVIMQNMNLPEIASEVMSLPSSPHWPWLIHSELVVDDTCDFFSTSCDKIQPCRVENFSTHHVEWNRIQKFCSDISGQLFGNAACLFKDKLNYKFPKGEGYKLHQDVTAYVSDKFAKDHITAMVVVDTIEPDMGPLELAPGKHKDGIFENHKGVILAEEEEKHGMVFKPILASSGDLVFFSSYLPHKSSKNVSKNPRRIAFLTFNPENQGKFHHQYYAEKRASFETGTGGTISINDDFNGRIVK